MAESLSKGIERVLRKAREDPEFRAGLFARRSAAAHEALIVLTPSERAILDSVEESLLEGMLASLPDRTVDEYELAPPAPGGIRPDLPGELVRGTRPDEPGELVRGTRPGLPIAIAAGALLAGAALAGTCLTAGIRPDVPPPRSSAPAQGPAAGDAAGDTGTVDPTKRDPEPGTR